MADRQAKSHRIARLAAGLALAAMLTGCGEASPPNSTTDGGGPSPAAPQLDPSAARAALLGPWRAEPISLWPALLEAVARECSASMQPFPAVPLVAVDARGKGRLQAFFAGPGGVAACYDMTLDAKGTVSAMGGGMTGTGANSGPLDAHALVSAGVSGSGGLGNVVTSSVINGQAGPGIARVVIVMPGQVPMTATLSNGWYVFWWPGALPSGTSVVGLDAFGTQVAKSDP